MPNAESLIGATLGGKFRIKRVLGAGSMGFVCEAEHLELGKRVAVKLIDAALAHDETIANRFRREARAASRVESEHIVQVFDVGRDEKFGLYIVMENLIGEDLAARLARESVLDTETSVRIGCQVARALHKAHAAGVVHRDLKPANIFLADRDDGLPFVKILDFGISKLQETALDRSVQMQLTRAGTAVGTPQYMSPEQAQGLPSVDFRTDIWSLGVVLYEMLSGTFPFPELPTYEQFIIHMVTKPPRPLSEVAPWVPIRLCSVVHDAIVHDPKARIPDGQTFAARLLDATPYASSGSIARASGRHVVASPKESGAFEVNMDDDEDEAPNTNETIVMSSPPSLDSADNAPATTRTPPRGAAMARGRGGPSGSVPARPSLYEKVENEEITDDDAPMFFQRESVSPSGRPLPFPSVKLKIPKAPLAPSAAALGGISRGPTARNVVPAGVQMAPAKWLRYLPVALGIVVVMLGVMWRLLR